MIANYHTHTPRCRHAEGTEEEYIQAAMDAGIQILGFSDHTPFWFPGEYYSYMRMFPHQLEEYCEAVRTVKKQYEGKLQIHLGLEVEYYPALFERARAEAIDCGVEYFLLGQHWVGNEENEPYCGRQTEDETILERYCDQVVAGVNTGWFSYIAHPDLIHFTGDAAAYKKHMRRLCREANACNTPIEINLLGLATGRQYPTAQFWEIAAEENCCCILGRDAHQPCAFADAASEQKALEFVKAYGLKLIDTLPLRAIG